MSYFDFVRDIRPSGPTFLPKDYPDLTGKIALVTGSSAGIGREVVRLLLEQKATVVTFNRNREKTEGVNVRIKKEIIEAHPELKDVIDDRLIPVYGDLSDLTSIKPAANHILNKVDKLDLVILNAGAMVPPNGSVTKQGYELQIGVNNIAQQLLLELVNPLVLKSLETSTIENSPPRVIFLSSTAHLVSPKNGGIDFNRGFKDASISSTGESYGQSKAAAIYQAYIYGQKHPDVISLAVHPGYISTELSRYLPGFAQTLYSYLTYSPVYGAYTELFGALDPSITTKDNGRYIVPWGKFREARNDIKEGCTNGTAKKFWDAVEEIIKPYV